MGNRLIVIINFNCWKIHSSLFLSITNFVIVFQQSSCELQGTTEEEDSEEIPTDEGNHLTFDNYNF